MKGVGKRQTENIVDRLRATTPTAETDLASVRQALAIALADNLKSSTPPPYELVGIAEQLQLGPLIPDAASTSDIAAECLAGMLPLARDGVNRLEAHRAVAESAIAETWFEAGETIEDLLAPVRTEKRRISVLLQSYLPGRRAYWARLCALSALALRGPACATSGPLPARARDRRAGPALRRADRKSSADDRNRLRHREGVREQRLRAIHLGLRRRNIDCFVAALLAMTMTRHCERSKAIHVSTAALLSHNGFAANETWIASSALLALTV